ncbi:Uncharacterised protein [Escherichia coli]|uniref:Uncharacterized protein n=1 Tax=Escherichia coli TaxID=562 RepID=A0A376MVL5_ECOLX|nr:Uncharacterised protein [Escherichia coli]
MQAGLGALRGGLLAAFTSPGGALISLGRGIGILALRLSGLPALWGIGECAVGALGGALGFSVKSGGPLGGDTGRCGSAYLAALGPAEGCRGRVLVRPVAGAYATARGCGTTGTAV